MEWVLGAYYLIALGAASGKHKTEGSSCERESSRARMHRDLQRGRNSGWRVYSGETSRIIKRNAADVLGVTRLDGGKLDLRGWNWLTQACTVVPFSNGAHMFYKIVPAYINKTGKKPRPETVMEIAGMDHQEKSCYTCILLHMIHAKCANLSFAKLYKCIYIHVIYLT